MKKCLIFLIVLLTSFSSGNAQLIIPKTLKTPIEKALDRSKEINNKEIDVQKTALKRQLVLSKYIPRVEATAGYAYFDNKLTVDIPGIKLPLSGTELFGDKTKFDNHGNLFHAGVMAKSVLFSGMQIQNGAKALKYKSKGDALLIETTKDELILEVITSFDKIKYLRVSENLLTDSDHRLEKEEKRVNTAIDNGLAVPYDRDKIKLARIKLETKRTELEESKKLLLQKLNYLTGMSAKAIKSILYDLNPIVLKEGLTVENKQELEALASYKAAKEYVVKKEKGSFWPQVAAFGGVSYSSLFSGASTVHSPYLPSALPDPQLRLHELTLAPNWLIGVGLKWEIFGGTARKHQVNKAELSVQQLHNKLEDSRDKLNLLLSQKWASYKISWKQIELAHQQKVMAKNSLTQAKEQYQHGLISINQRLEAENEHIKAGQKKTKSLIKERQAAIETLMVTGHLSQKIHYQ